MFCTATPKSSVDPFGGLGGHRWAKLGLLQRGSEGSLGMPTRTSNTNRPPNPEVPRVCAIIHTKYMHTTAEPQVVVVGVIRGAHWAPIHHLGQGKWEN